MALLSFITRRDHSLMRRVHRWSAPRWIRLWMICATRGGDGWLWYAMGAAILLFGGEERFRAIGAFLVSGTLAIGLFLSIKRFTGRRRPCHIEPHCWATLLPPDQFSFPSGHTMSAFAVAISFGAFYPTLFPGLLFCALSIAASRILLGMHFLSDVVAGGILGAAIGYAAASLFR